MKKIILLVFCCFLFAACHSKTESNETLESDVLIFSAQKEDTNDYLYAKSIHRMWRDTLPEIPIDFHTNLKGEVSAIDEIEQGLCDIAIGNALAAKWTEKESVKKVRAIAGGLAWANLNVFFTKDFVNETGITAIEQIAEQKYPARLVVKQKGTFSQLSAEKLFEILGIDFEILQSWGGKIIYVDSEREMISLLNEGKADIVINSATENHEETKRLCLETELYFPQLKDATIEKLKEIGYSSTTIYKHTWTGQKETISTVMSPLVLLVSADVPNEMVYKLTKNINQIDVWTKIDKDLQFDFETTSSLTGIQLHEGALQYYKDFGWEPLENYF